MYVPRCRRKFSTPGRRSRPRLGVGDDMSSSWNGAMLECAWAGMEKYSGSRTRHDVQPSVSHHIGVSRVMAFERSLCQPKVQTQTLLK